MRHRARATATLISCALVLQSGCGTILYPDRRGQKSGRIDAGVAVLDGIGLLFFILPGVIAFAVDFGDGAIYLPAKPASVGASSAVERVRFDPGGDARASVERIVRERAGVSVRLDQEDMRVITLRDRGQLQASVAAWQSRGPDTPAPPGGRP